MTRRIQRWTGLAASTREQRRQVVRDRLKYAFPESYAFPLAPRRAWDGDV